MGGPNSSFATAEAQIAQVASNAKPGLTSPTSTTAAPTTSGATPTTSPAPATTAPAAPTSAPAASPSSAPVSSVAAGPKGKGGDPGMAKPQLTTPSMLGSSY